MRPASIVNFERFYFGSLGLGFANTLISWNATVSAANSQSGARLGESAVAAILYITLGFGLVVSFLLWYFIARRASVVAKWILVVLYAFSLIQIIVELVNGTFGRALVSPLAVAITVVIYLLEVATVLMLFRPDANAWFANRGYTPHADVFS